MRTITRLTGNSLQENELTIVPAAPISTPVEVPVEVDAAADAACCHRKKKCTLCARATRRYLEGIRDTIQIEVKIEVKGEDIVARHGRSATG